MTTLTHSLPSAIVHVNYIINGLSNGLLLLYIECLTRVT